VFAALVVTLRPIPTMMTIGKVERTYNVGLGFPGYPPPGEDAALEASLAVT
jgi:hypothetical protein